MKQLALILFTLLIQACAFTDASLQVQHDASADVVGPVSDIDNLLFANPEIEDRRLDKERIGWKKNGYGQNTADITTVQPVEEIVEIALLDAIQDNGHVISEQAAIMITGSVERFWFETDVNFWTVDFMGDIQCTLNFVDVTTSETIYSSSYTGSHKKTSGGGLEKTWSEVMNEALNNLIEDIVFDEDLAEALASYRQQ